MNGSDPTDQTRPRVPVSTEDTARVATPFPFLAPRQQADELGRYGDYRVLRLLGSGGMGFVFAAEDATLRRQIALKILKPELAADPESRERFLREARAAAEITSDYVVTVLHVGEAGGLPYLAMPLLPGETLQARIEKPDRLDLRTALIVCRDVAAGLAAAHAKGLIHRDVKPANVWLERLADVTCEVRNPDCATDSSDALGRPPRCPIRARLLDFGLARRPLTETSLTSTGFIVGTPNYMAPEQAAGHEVDHRADLFALGCIIYAVLTGELPFKGGTAMAVMMALANKHPDPVNSTNPAVPQTVADLVAKLLAKRPEDRVQSAGEVVCALEDAIAGLSATNATAVAPARPPAAPAHPDTMPAAVAPTLPPAPVPPPARHARRRAVLVGAALAAVLASAVGFGWWALRPAPPPEPIVVGVLHSQTGTMAVSENPVIDATLLAIDEVNAAGGVLGRQLRPVVVDGKSDPDEFARQAERLLTEDKAAAVFGCWTSASRKAVRPVVQRNNGLLFYPVQYEGLEESPRIVYLGPAPNQQLLPAVDFVIDKLQKKRIALVGSDYVFPRTAHAIITDHVQQRGGAAVVADVFVPLGSADVREALAEVRRKKPDAIVNTVNGTSNAAFFKAVRGADDLKGVPTISVSITENEVRGLNPSALSEDYIAASYFQSVDRPQGRAFLKGIRDKYGADRVASDMMAAAYTGVHLWAKAAAAAGTADPSDVLAKVRGLEFDGPGARVRVDPANLHAWLPVRIGRITPSGQVEPVPGVGSEEPVAPVPFPPTRTRKQWDQFLGQLETEWHGKWQAPPR